MKDRYDDIVSGALHQIAKLECRNIKVEYVVMNSYTEEYLGNRFLSTFMSVGFDGIKIANSTMYGHKVLVDDNLEDDEIKVVGGLQHV